MLGSFNLASGRSESCLLPLAHAAITTQQKMLDRQKWGCSIKVAEALLHLGPCHGCRVDDSERNPQLPLERHRSWKPKLKECGTRDSQNLAFDLDSLTTVPSMTLG